MTDLNGTTSALSCAMTIEDDPGVTTHWEIRATGETLCGLGPAPVGASVSMPDAAARGATACIACQVEYFDLFRDGWTA